MSTPVAARPPYAKRPAPPGPLKSYLDLETGNIQRGMLALKVRTVFADASVEATDDTIEVDASAGAVTITLPPPDRLLYLRVNIKRVNNSDDLVTVVGNMDGIGGFELRANGQVLTVQSDGVTWLILQQELDPGSYVVPQGGRSDTTLTQYLANNAAVNVLDFPGVVADGVHDDTVGIQAALDAAVANRAVRFPGGHSYKTTADLVINGAMTIYGDGLNAQLLCYNCNGFKIASDYVEIRDLYLGSYSAGGVARPFTKSGIISDDVAQRNYLLVNNVTFDGWNICVNPIRHWATRITYCISAGFNNVGIQYEKLCADVVSARNFWTMSNGTSGLRRGIHCKGSGAAGDHQESVFITDEHIFGCDIAVGNYLTLALSMKGTTIDGSVIAYDDVSSKQAVITGNPYLLASDKVIQLAALGTPATQTPRITGNNIICTNGPAIVIGGNNHNGVISGNQILSGAPGATIPVADALDASNVSGWKVTENDVLGSISFDASCVRNVIRNNAAIVPAFIVAYTNQQNIVRDNVNFRTPKIAGFRNNHCTYAAIALPTTGTYNVGDVIQKESPAAAASPGWVCTEGGTFGLNTTTGNVTVGSDILTGVADTSAFNIGDYITTTTRANGALTPFVIVDKTANTLKVLQGAWVTSGAVTITQVDPTFATMPDLT